MENLDILDIQSLTYIPVSGVSGIFPFSTAKKLDEFRDEVGIHTVPGRNHA